MSETLTLELAGHVSRMCLRMCRVALASIMVVVAWLFLPAMFARAEAPFEGTPSAASTVGDVHAVPSVLLLPPRLPTGAGDTARAAAEAACDRLAQDIAAAGLARVVDRTQVDRILQERTLQTVPLRPILSYDAMIRLEADTTRLAPQTMLSLIDLSTGNILAQQAFVWPPNEAAAKPMLAFCRDSLKSIGKPAAGKLRVRTLWAADAIASERLRPLARRLIEVFDGALQRSDRVVPVHHLEAATAKEESLLLLMGLSRLPGGRQFTPQADATIELRVVEGDGQGKTFPETPVEIGVRLRKGAGYQGNWITTAGLVRTFDTLVPQAWRKLAQSLGEVRPETAKTLLNEMSLRRKQAEAELDTVRELRKSNSYSDDRGIRALMAELVHAEAAVKLDPTYTEAMKEHVRVLAYLSDHDWEHRWAPEAPFRTLQEALRYMERFRQDSELCGELCTHAYRGVLRSPLDELCQPHRSDDPLAPFTNDMLTLMPELVQSLDAAKRLLERGFEDDVKFRYNTAEGMVVATGRGMRLMNVPAADRQEWLRTIARRCLEKVKRSRSRDIDATYDWQDCIHLQVRIAELLIEDGRMDAAKRIMAQAQSEMPVTQMASAHSVIDLMRAVVRKADDAQLLADFNAWIKRGEKSQVNLIYIEWPTVDVFAGQRNGDPVRIDDDRSPVKIRNIGDDHHVNYRLLGEGDGRLYFHAISPLWIAYLPLDANGGPIGKAARGPTGSWSWDSIKEIPQPAWNESANVTSAQYTDGKLCVGTRGFGLQVFDPKTETWKGYGPAQGLPSPDVDEFFPIGGHVLYCNTKRTHYMLNLADGAVTLVHRADPRSWEKDWMVDWNLLSAWRDGQRVVAIDRYGAWDNLLSNGRKRTPLPGQTCYGWRAGDEWYAGILGVVESGGRRLCVGRGGLYELDAAGKVKRLRAWEIADYHVNQRDPAGWPIAPADCPLAGTSGKVCAIGSQVILDSSHLTVYDVDSDTWYGPLDFGVDHPLATPRGKLWGASVVGITCLALDEAVAYAKGIGRAMTTAEYRRRRQQFIDAAKPLDQAKLTLGMRQFDKAKAALQQVLDAEPRQPEALILMGFLHDGQCLNQPDEAVKYYRRAAELEDNPSLAYTAMYFWARVLRDRKQWQETGDLCVRILQRYPGLEERDRQIIQDLYDESQRQLPRKDAKQQE